jgi:hypothetical protein
MPLFIHFGFALKLIMCVDPLTKRSSTRGVTCTIMLFYFRLMVDTAYCLFTWVMGGRVGFFVLSFGRWDEGDAKFVAAACRFSLIFLCFMVVLIVLILESYLIFLFL